MKRCSGCKIEKEYCEYHKNCRTHDGYANYCKSCLTRYQSNSKKVVDEFNLHGVTEQDYRMMYKFLESMGYDIYGNIPKQFAQRHNLKYKSRKSKVGKNNSGPEILEKLKRENLISDK